MHFNIYALLIGALIPMIVGFIWYHPKVFGTTWMRVAGLTEESLKGGNMAVIFGVSYLLGLMLTFFMHIVVIHQMHIFSVLANDPGINDPTTEMGKWFVDFMAKNGHNFRTFKHGVLHGTIAGLFFALPLLGTNAMFERKGFKYIAVNAGYWIITLALIGGIVSGWE